MRTVLGEANDARAVAEAARSASAHTAPAVAAAAVVPTNVLPVASSVPSA